MLDSEMHQPLISAQSPVPGNGGGRRYMGGWLGGVARRFCGSAGRAVQTMDAPGGGKRRQLSLCCIRLAMACPGRIPLTRDIRHACPVRGPFDMASGVHGNKRKKQNARGNASRVWALRGHVCLCHVLRLWREFRVFAERPGRCYTCQTHTKPKEPPRRVPGPPSSPEREVQGPGKQERRR
jgi:hypothetical protein